MMNRSWQVLRCPSAGKPLLFLKVVDTALIRMPSYSSNGQRALRCRQFVQPAPPWHHWPSLEGGHQKIFNPHLLPGFETYGRWRGAGGLFTNQGGFFQIKILLGQKGCHYLGGAGRGITVRQLSPPKTGRFQVVNTVSPGTTQGTADTVPG